MQQHLMIEGDVRRKMISFAIPIFIGHFFQQLYNTVDSLIVGRLIDKTALAAVTGTSAFIYLMTAFFMGFSTGAGVVIARHIGARDEKQTGLAVHTAVAMGLVFSVAMTGCGLMISPTVLRLLGTPEDVFDRALSYLRVYFMGSSALVMYNIFVGILQAAGDSRHPLIYLVISSLTNIVLDAVFIAWFHMDVDGAALATVLSELLSAVLVISRLTRHGDSIRVRVKRLTFHRDNLRTIIRYGHNRWDYSTFRQYLNSSARKGTWWTQGHVGQVPPSNAYTVRGYMAGCSSNLLAVAHKVKVYTKSNSNLDSATGLYETLDTFWLPSRRQMYGGDNGGEGEYFPYWKQIADEYMTETLGLTGETSPTDDDRSNAATGGAVCTTRIQRNRSSSAVACRLRSASTGYSCYAWNVGTPGYLSNGYSASNAYAGVPACVIW